MGKLFKFDLKNFKCNLNLSLILSSILLSLLSLPTKSLQADRNPSEDNRLNNERSLEDEFDLEYDPNEPGAENWIKKSKKRTGFVQDNEKSLPDIGSVQEEKIKFVAEWNQTTVEYEFLIELTSEYYCERFGQLHVLCSYKDDKPGVTYYERGVDEVKIEFILAYLIRLRKRLLLGKETSGDPGPLPKAMKICIMVWSEELQVVAQKIANQVRVSLNTSLIYSTDKFSRLAVTIAVSKDTEDKPRWTFALNHWYSQVKLVPPTVIYHPDGKYKDYTAMIWGKTFQVGCGYVAVGGKKDNGFRIKIYVCAFGPGGNHPGEKIYMTDTAEIMRVTTTPKPEIKDEVTQRPITGPNPFDRHTPICILPGNPSSRTSTTTKPEEQITKPPVTRAPVTKVTKAPVTKTTKGSITKKTTSTTTIPETEIPTFPVTPIIFDNTTRKFILQQPYIVLIVYEALTGSSLKTFICTGSIYNSKWIITSYQCALPSIQRQQGKPKYKIGVVYYGEIILKINIGLLSDYFRYIVNAVFPDELDTKKIGIFDNLDSSIVCLEIQTDFTFSKYTKLVKVASDLTVYDGGEFAMFIGWKVSYSSKTVDVAMQKFQMTIHSSEESRQIFSGFNTVARFTAKMTTEYVGKYTCTQDIGGAFVRIILTDNNQAPVPSAEVYLLGILPASMCQRTEAKVDMVEAEYFTTVYKWITWIKTVAGDQDTSQNLH